MRTSRLKGVLLSVFMIVSLILSVGPVVRAQEGENVFTVSPGEFTAHNVPVGELYISRNLVVWNRDNVERVVHITVDTPPVGDVRPGYAPIPNENWVQPYPSSFTIEKNSSVEFHIWLSIPQQEALKGQKWGVWAIVERQSLKGEEVVLTPIVRMNIETTKVYELITNVEPSGSGFVGLNPSGGTYDEGTDVTVTADPASGYEFDRWSGDAAGTSMTIAVMMDSDKSVTAHFTPIRYNLAISVNPLGGGSVDLDPPGGTYDSGTSVELTATASPEYIFSQWSGNASGTSTSVTITMDSNKSVTAHFERTQIEPTQYDLVTFVTPSGSGYVGLSPSGGTYDLGTEVTVTAFPASGYEFDHWSGDASGTSTSVTVTMNSDRSVTAHFASTEGGSPEIQLGVGIGVAILVIAIAVVAVWFWRRRKREGRRLQEEVGGLPQV